MKTRLVTSVDHLPRWAGATCGLAVGAVGTFGLVLLDSAGATAGFGAALVGLGVLLASTGRVRLAGAVAPTQQEAARRES